MTGRFLDGRYRIGSRIARGGMASVYEATDVRLDRTVAVKVMHPGLGDDDEFAARFVREARAAARLSHPNVVAVYDQGDEDGTVFLAMEMVQGHTLRDVIRKESPMSPPRAMAVLEPVLSALAAAHRAGLIHRDVKPENVLIADDGRVKVADFGLAKAVSADTQHTATGGVLIGTVSYLAPELVVDGRADARADVYAAGVVLYELLTGKKPHEGDSPIHVAYKHVHEDVPAAVGRRLPASPGTSTRWSPGPPPATETQRPADAAVMLHQLHRVSQALVGRRPRGRRARGRPGPADAARGRRARHRLVGDDTDGRPARRHRRGGLRRRRVRRADGPLGPAAGPTATGPEHTTALDRTPDARAGPGGPAAAGPRRARAAARAPPSAAVQARPDHLPARPAARRRRGLRRLVVRLGPLHLHPRRDRHGPGRRGREARGRRAWRPSSPTGPTPRPSPRAG